MGFESLLSRLDGDEAGTRRGKLRAFEIILVLVVSTEYWTKYLRRWSDLGADELVALSVVTLLTVAIVHGRWRRAAFAGIALVQLWYIASLLPMTGNHRYLEAAFAGCFALLDDEDGPEQVLLLRGLRFMVIVVLFYSGLQKLVHGYWLQGQFLAWSLWQESFRTALQPLLPAEEFTRLTGDGPYRFSSWPAVFLSNATWLSEIALSALLIPYVIRAFACIATCALIIGAGLLVARELMFGVEFVAATLLFLSGSTLRRCVLPAAALLAGLVLVRLGIVPGARLPLSALKRSVVHMGLIAFALWPAVHIGLVKLCDVNPWKLAGWGMYSAPQIPAELRISCFTPDEVGVYPLRTLPPELEATQHEFLRMRLGLGRLARPTALARALLDDYPAIDGVAIEVVQPVLNRRTGFVEEHVETYEYRR